MSRGQKSKRRTAPKTSAPRGKQANGSKTTSKRSASSASKRQNKQTKPAAATPATGKKARKNVSQTIPNGTLIITNDENFYGADGKSKKVRMGVVVDSNRNDQLGIVKYTKSNIHGQSFSNNQGFVGHGDKIYTLDNEGNPIKIGEGKFEKGKDKRAIPPKTANEIKKRNIQESRYKNGNRANLRNLKGRRKNSKK